MATYPSFENIMTPLDQNRIIDPYQVRVFEENTINSHVFLSRVVNSLYTIFGNDIVIDGFDIDNTDISWTETDGSFVVNPGMCIHDTTLLKLNSKTSVHYPRLSARNADKGRIVLFLRYQYLQTIEPNLFKIVANFIPTHENPIPVETFNEDTDRTLIGIFEFEKDGADRILSITKTDEKYIDIKLATGIKRYWLYGYDPDKMTMKKYISSIITGNSSIIWDDYLNTLALVGDLLNPGLNKYWGTNWSGNKGWYDIPFILDDTLDQERDIWQFRDIEEIKFNGYNYANLTITEDEFSEPYPYNTILTKTTDLVNPIDRDQCYKLEITPAASGNNDYHNISIAPGFGGVPGYYRATFYARRGNLSKVYARIGDALLSNGLNHEVIYVYDLVNNTSHVFDENNYSKDFGMMPISDGWYKCWFTFESKTDSEDVDFCYLGMWNESVPITNYNGQFFIGNLGDYVYSYGFQITYSPIYHTFNDDDIVRTSNAVNMNIIDYHFILTGAKSTLANHYEVIVNNEIVSNDWYYVQRNSLNKIELVIEGDDGIYFDEDAVVIIKYLEYHLNGEDVKFSQLSDTPDSYRGQKGTIVQVNNDENGLWFTNVNDLLNDKVVLLDKFQSINSTKIFEQDVIIKGRLIVENITEQPITNSPINDNFIILNRGEEGEGVTAGTSGVRIYRGPNSPGANLQWNEDKKYWEVGYHQSGEFSPLLTSNNFNDFRDEIGFVGDTITHDITPTNNHIVLTKEDIGRTIFIRLTNTDATIELPDINGLKLAEFWLATISVNNSTAVATIQSINNQRMMYRSEFVPNIRIANGEWIELVKSKDNVWTSQISGQSTGMTTATYESYGFTRLATMLDVANPDSAPIDAVINAKTFHDGFTYLSESLIDQLNQDRLSDRVYNYMGSGLQRQFPLDSGSSPDSTKYLVFVGGVAQSPQIHYTIDNGQVTFNDPPKLNSPIMIRSSVATEVGQVEYALRIHTHAITDVVGLESSLNSKSDYNTSNQVIGTFPGRNIIFEQFTNGAYSVTFPDLYSGSLYYVEVHMKGAGGGGSGLAESSDAVYGGETAVKTGSGGGEGEFIKFITTVAPNTSMTMTIGRGGLGTPVTTSGTGTRGWETLDPDAGEQTLFGTITIANGGSGAKTANSQSSFGGLGGGNSILPSITDQLFERTKGEDGFNGTSTHLLTNMLDSRAGKGGGKEGGNVHVGTSDGKLGCGGSGGYKDVINNTNFGGGAGGDGFMIIYALGKEL